MLCVLAACEEETPFLYDAANTGVYIYGEESEINLADNAHKNYVTDTFVISVKLAGYTYDTDQVFVLKTEEHPDYTDYQPIIELADSYVLKADTNAAEVRICVHQPELLNTVYGVNLVLDTEAEASTLQEGAEGLKHTLLIKEHYTQPDGWYSYAWAIGEYSPAKHQHMIRTLLKDHFLVWSTIGDDAATCVDDLRTYYSENPDAEIKTFDYPFLDSKTYAKPASYDETEEEFYGEWSSKLLRLLYETFDLNYKSEVSFLSKTDLAELKSNNKVLAEKAWNDWCTSFEQYMYSYPEGSLLQVPLLDDVDYELGKHPLWDTYPQNLAGEYIGDGSNFGFIIKYYGEYSDAKWEFMLNCLPDDYNKEDLFPVYKRRAYWNGSAYYSMSLKGYPGQEHILVDNNALFVEKLDEYNAAHPSNPLSFTFPIINE